MATTAFSFLGFYGNTGAQLIDPQDLTELSQFTVQANTGITALAGGAQAGSPVLKIGVNNVTTVATTNDSVQLPQAIPGLRVLVINDGASTLRIYAGVSPNTYNGGALDQIKANNTVSLTANGTAVTTATGTVAEFVCATPGVWKRLYAAS